MLLNLCEESTVCSSRVMYCQARRCVRRSVPDLPCCPRIEIQDIAESPADVDTKACRRGIAFQWRDTGFRCRLTHAQEPCDGLLISGHVQCVTKCDVVQ